MPELGLGRLVKPDPRDHNWALRATRPPVTVQRRTSKWWPNLHKPLNQGARPTCVAHAVDAMLTATKVVNKTLGPKGREKLYDEAQKLDGFPLPHDGTTARAACKVLQRMGLISSYRWGWSLDDILDELLTPDGGPVLLGVNWYRQMSDPTPEGFIKIGGQLDGGHEVLLWGANLKKGIVGGINSWGAGWGKNGRFYMDFETLDTLMRQDGDIVVVEELKGSV